MERADGVPCAYLASARLTPFEIAGMTPFEGAVAGSEEPTLTLMPADGGAFLTLGASKQGLGLRLSDENGKVRAGLSALKEGPALALFDENGNVRAGLSALKGGPRLDLYDENGKNRAGLGVAKDGPLLELYDENGKPRAQLGAGLVTMPDGRKITYAESSIRLSNAEAKVIWQAP